MARVVVEHKTTSADITPGSPYWRRLTLDAQVSLYLGGAGSLLYDVIRKPTLRPLKATPVEARRYTLPKSRACPLCRTRSGAATAPHAYSADGAPAVPGAGGPTMLCVDGRIITDPGGKLYADQRDADETPDAYEARLLADIAQHPDAYYQRGTVVRTEEEAQEAGRDVWMTARMIRESRYLDAWPRNPSACDAYGRTCDYWPVCSGTASIDDDVLYRDAGAQHEELPGVRHSLPLLTSSSLSTYRACPRRYLYSYERRRRPIATAHALTFGTLIHAGLEVWWSTLDVDAALVAVSAAKDPYDAATARALIAGYHARWADEPLTVVGVERVWVRPLLNPTTGAASKSFELAGKIDAEVEA